MTQPAAAGTKRRLQIWLAVVGLAMLAVPPTLIGLSGTASTDPLWTALRLAALEAFTLITASMVISTFRPLFNRALGPRTVQRFHSATGVTGFSLALAHGVMVLVFGLAGYRMAPAWIGPAALVVLATTIAGALYRRHLRRTWRWIHRANYFVFAAVLTHGVSLGYDFQNALFLKVCFAIYAAVVAAGFVYRAWVSLSALRRDR